MGTGGKALFAVSLGATAAAFAWMESISPGRIIELEFAFTTGRANDVLRDWAAGDPELDQGMRYLFRDFAFLGVYWVPMTLALRWAGASRWLAALPPLAAGLDAVENAFLILLTAEARDGGAHTTGAAVTAGVAATAKWAIVGWTFWYAGRAALRRRRQRASTIAS